MRAAVLLLALAACGSSAPVEKPVVQPRVEAPVAAPVESEQAHRDRITAEHHKLEDEQATALAAACDAPTPHAKKRCAPSCYEAEPADSRAGKPVKAPIEIVHTVCAQAAAPDTGPFVILDELGADLRVPKGKPPAAGKQNSWQARVETDTAAALKPLLARGDAIRVLGTWKPATHPVTKEQLRCVYVAHFAHGLRKPLDACGGPGVPGQLACEATDNAAAHGINVVHFRLAEATRLHGVHDEVGCQEAASEAIAVARGLPRWRQYTKLNTKLWQSFARYRTRFDGLLDEDELFTAAAALGARAEQLYATCTGAAAPHTSAADEQSFHTCW